MQLHGLWPDFGSLYNTYGTPAIPLPLNLAGAYQGWPQYCRPLPGVTSAPDFSTCHVNGGLCPEAGTTNQVCEMLHVEGLRKWNGWLQNYSPEVGDWGQRRHFHPVLSFC